MLYLLLLSGTLCIAGAYLSYAESSRAAWFPWAMGTLGLACSLVWAWAVRLEPDKAKLYAFSIWWDVVTFSVYYGLPLAVCGVRPSTGVCVGAAIVACGLVVVKVYS